MTQQGRFITLLVTYPLMWVPEVLLAQNCRVDCDTTTGTSYWIGGSPPGELDDWDVRCGPTPFQYVICGGYGSSIGGVASFPNTSVGAATAVQYNGTVYLVYGYHNWSENLDRIYMSVSFDAKTFYNPHQIIANSQFCISGSGCEFWGPRLLIRDDGTWLLYITGHLDSSDTTIPRVFLATSTDGGYTFNFVWQWDSVNNRYQGILDDANGTYRFGAITTQPNGQFVYYATSNVDNYTYQFTSSDGVTWARSGSTGYWGIGLSQIRYDARNGYYLATADPPISIANDCNTPTFQYPPILLSTDGLTFSLVSWENYFYGAPVISAEAVPLADNKNVIQATTPQVLYMNTQASSQYNQGGSQNGLFVMDWRTASYPNRRCTYP